ncbi:MAG: hypothetical protein COA88_11810 [Kordia sp.]|nr:MAG: hypothetical protein COA88_11810 [Kordia sp.]
MTLFTQFFEWHPKFRVQPFSTEHFRLLSELETHIVDLPTEPEIFELLEKQSTLSVLSEKIPVSSVLNLSQQIQSYLNSGYIRSISIEKIRYSYHTPDFCKEIHLLKNKSGFKEIQILSQYENIDLFMTHFNQIPIDNEYCLVIVDDYLDPRLELINKAYVEKKQKWVLIKLTGEHAFVGPVFKQKDNTPCWQCLNYRMRANNALRWIKYEDSEIKYDELTSYIGKNIIEIPIRFDENLIKKHVQLSVSVLKNLLDNDSTDQFYEIHTDYKEPWLHPVIKRPQCSCCGDKYLYQKQTQSPINLQSSKKIFTKDGGVRCVSPEETCTSLKKTISPVSGLLNHCSTLSKKGKYINQIYRSGFFQIPRQLNALSHKLSNETFSYVTMGKGISTQQSQASALSEGIERLASQFQGDETILFCKPLANDPDYILPQQLTPFTDRQYASFGKEQNKEYQLYAAEKYMNSSPLHWTVVWSLTNERQRYLPLSYCYAHTPFDDQKFNRFYHNGGAAGNTLEEAILQGFLEVIERDAISIWWYNQVPRDEIQFDDVSSDLLQQMSHTLEEEWDYWAIDISSDFDIPVIAAISKHKITGQICFGFGCHIDAMIACQRALTELCQITEIRDKNTAPFNFDAIKNAAFLFPSKNNKKQLESFDTPVNSDIKDDIKYCLAQASRLKLEVLVLNYSRPDMILHTAKVIIPGACHIFPYLAAERLYKVPVSMGLLPKEKKEEELNSQALLI